MICTKIMSCHFILLLFFPYKLQQVRKRDSYQENDIKLQNSWLVSCHISD